MKLVIIGYGGMGCHHHEKVFNNGVLTVVGAYDIAQDRRELARENGLIAYESEMALYNAQSDYDAVLIATPNDLHPYYTEKFSKLKKHIIVEKPACNNAFEFEKMMKWSTENNVVLMVHQNRRWDKDMLTVKKVVEDKTMGDVYRIETYVMGGNGVPGGWRKKIAQGGGMMLDWGVHLIDQACFMIDAKITSIYCDYSYILNHEVDDGFYLSMKFDNGLTYNITVDTNTFTMKPRWSAFGKSGTLEITDWNLTGKIVLKKESEEKIVGIKAGNGFTKTMATRPSSARLDVELPQVSIDEQEFYKNFVNACNKTEEVLIKNEQVLRVFKIMQLAEQSAKEEQVLKGLNI